MLAVRCRALWRAITDRVWRQRRPPVSVEPPPISSQLIPMFTDGRKFRVYCHLVLQAMSMLPDAILSSCVNHYVGQSKGIRDRDAILAHLAKLEKGFTDEKYKRFASCRLPRIVLQSSVLHLHVQE